VIRETFAVPPLGCNCSVLGDEVSGEAIVVDPGGDIPRILAALAKHKLTVKQILVTHAHIDHIAGAASLKKITGAPILYNQRDVPLAKMMDFQAGLFGLVVQEVELPDDSLEEGRAVAVGVGPEGTGGVTGTILHTPGHSEGSVCLFLPGENLLLSGDTLFAGNIGRSDLPGGNGKTLVRSIKEKLLTLPDATVVVPGHGAKTTIGMERETNPFLG
jgi:glyoxylase-like metal-dependent hydrolase (beta-lactamase superfamily II)